MHYLNFTVDQRQEQQPNTEGTNEEASGPPSDDWEPIMHVRENGPDPADMAAYGAIYKKLLEVQKADKKKWHHRPVYRVSAICRLNFDLLKPYSTSYFIASLDAISHLW